jgi:hypothetical protein
MHALCRCKIIFHKLNSVANMHQTNVSLISELIFWKFLTKLQANLTIKFEKLCFDFIFSCLILIRFHYNLISLEDENKSSNLFYYVCFPHFDINLFSIHKLISSLFETEFSVEIFEWNANKPTNRCKI